MSCSLMQHPFVVHVLLLPAPPPPPPPVIKLFGVLHGWALFLPTQRGDLLQEIQVMHQAQLKAEIQAVMVSRPDLVSELLQPGEVPKDTGAATNEK